MDKKTKKFLITLSSVMLIFILVCAAIILTIKNRQETVPANDPDATFQQESVKLSEEYADQHPIIAILPLETVSYDQNYNQITFRIDGGSFENCSSDFCLQITDQSDESPTQNPAHESAIRQKATDLLRAKSQNPDDYEILYFYKPVQPLDK